MLSSRRQFARAQVLCWTRTNPVNILRKFSPVEIERLKLSSVRIFSYRSTTQCDAKGLSHNQMKLATEYFRVRQNFEAIQSEVMATFSHTSSSTVLIEKNISIMQTAKWQTSEGSLALLQILESQHTFLFRESKFQISYSMETSSVFSIDFKDDYNMVLSFGRSKHCCQVPNVVAGCTNSLTLSRVTWQLLSSLGCSFFGVCFSAFSMGWIMFSIEIPKLLMKDWNPMCPRGVGLDAFDWMVWIILILNTCECSIYAWKQAVCLCGCVGYQHK